MAFTQQDLEAVEAAIRTGAKRVEYADKVVEYNSLDDLLRLRNIIREELEGSDSAEGARRVAVFNKGIYPNDKPYR